MYKDVINDGLAELNKYYSWFDEKPSYVLALVLHLYYKLSYIAHAWGGGEEVEVEILAGNLNARNWQAEAQKILKNMMAKYWETRTGPLNSNANGRIDRIQETGGGGELEEAKEADWLVGTELAGLQGIVALKERGTSEGLSVLLH
ncbi:hypothetical protein EDB86DRAFT_3088015 [Lactarius hatsudake]|nr:hypothetical protein EDB86DRAFT_3088015 [Lactarius hatsudake]